MAVEAFLGTTKGNFLLAFAKKLHTRSSISAEFLAVLRAFALISLVDGKNFGLKQITYWLSKLVPTIN